MSTTKFVAGDTFKVKENGITGQVIKVREESMYGHHYEVWYTVMWDHFSRNGEFPASDVDDLWEKTSPYVTTLAFGAGHIQHSKSAECDHKWKSYWGLFEGYDFCEKCNQKRGL